MKNYYRKFLWILFIIAIGLLSINIFLEFFLSKNQFKKDYAVEVENLESRFLSTLGNFGLNEEWIQKRSSEDYPIFLVSVPTDLTIPEIMLDINNEFRKDSILLTAEERNTGGKTSIKLNYVNQVLLQADFNYSKKNFRERGKIAILIKEIQFDSLEDSVLLESAEKFSILINPAEDNLDHLAFIKENRKSFVVLISDDITDPTYKLDEKYSQVRLLNVVKALSVDYSSSSFFVVDDNSEFYKSDKYKFFYNELSKRKVKMLILTDLISLENADNIITAFNLEMKDMKKDGLKIFLLSKEDYLLLKPEILLYKKNGVKIVNGSAINL